MDSVTTQGLFNQVVEFTTDPRQQSDLLAALVQRTERITCTCPGFVSASVQASADGCRVLQQMLWQSRHASEVATINIERDAADFMRIIFEHRVSAVTFNGYEQVQLIGARG